jgi:hypothetical protein
MKEKRFVSIEKLNKIVGEGNEPIEIEALDNDQFLKVRETLSRIGIATTQEGENVLWQSCNLLSKKGKYYIVHFKHMFLLDGAFKTTQLTDDDIKRTKYIASLLEAWGLVTRTGKNRGKAVEKINVRVINFNEKSEWTLKQKYDMSKNIKKVQPTE